LFENLVKKIIQWEPLQTN